MKRPKRKEQSVGEPRYKYLERMIEERQKYIDQLEASLIKMKKAHMSCFNACIPSDFCKDGKCDNNGCY